MWLKERHHGFDEDEEPFNYTAYYKSAVCCKGYSRPSVISVPMGFIAVRKEDFVLSHSAN